jgi:hypothetical protein
MLEEHFEEVQTMLLEMKNDSEENTGSSSQTDEGPQSLSAGFRSPPIIGNNMPRVSVNRGDESMRSPKMPALGYFSVPAASPRSPRSPMKRGF